MIIAVIPAHNEESGIQSAIQSVKNQVDQVWVICDNCTDGTRDQAIAAGALTYETVGNRDKKAGGLNQLLPRLVAQLQDTDQIFVMDADSRIAPDFMSHARSADPYSIIGGVFYGDPGGKLVGMMQRNEYARYARDIYAKNDKAMVLTGTATLHRVSALRMLMEARGDGLPGIRGQVYDTAALTEDNEITIALKTLGYKCVSPEGCKVYTEVMPTWGDLYRQRLRWQRGALENIKHYGITHVTKPYLRQQCMMIFGVLAMAMFLLLTVYQIFTGQINFSWWSLVGLVFVAERAGTVASRGWKQQIFAATLIPEMLYDFFLQGVLIKSLFDMSRGQEATWHHI